MTKHTVYSVAFEDDRFLMVYNPKRNGWEMPGGSIERGETVEQGAKREFLEEAGYDIEIVAVRDLLYCDVCACRLLNKKNQDWEMKSALFSELPRNLSFDRAEYEDVIPWAKSKLNGKYP